MCLGKEKQIYGRNHITIGYNKQDQFNLILKRFNMFLNPEGRGGGDREEGGKIDPSFPHPQGIRTKATGKSFSETKLSVGKL